MSLTSKLPVEAGLRKCPLAGLSNCLAESYCGGATIAAALQKGAFKRVATPNRPQRFRVLLKTHISVNDLFCQRYPYITCTW